MDTFVTRLKNIWTNKLNVQIDGEEYSVEGGVDVGPLKVIVASVLVKSQLAGQIIQVQYEQKQDANSEEHLRSYLNDFIHDSSIGSLIEKTRFDYTCLEKIDQDASNHFTDSHLVYQILSVLKGNGVI